MNMKIMTRTLLFYLLCITLISADSYKDQDMDGVPDISDQCPNTPFLNEVNKHGCSTKILIFPEERDDGSLGISFGYGFSNDEDDIDRTSQHTAKLLLSYYLNNWSFSLRTGYYDSDDGDTGMQDTSLKIKRKFKLNTSLKVSIGAGVKLPTYDFSGNKTDYTLYSSVIYYPKSSLSFFAGLTHTFVQDEEVFTSLQDINTVYVGSGYFFTRKIYANLAYSYVESKFTTNDPSNSIMAMLFYRFNDKWFTTLSYSHEIDDDLHNSFNIKFGYSIW